MTLENAGATAEVNNDAVIAANDTAVENVAKTEENQQVEKTVEQNQETPWPKKAVNALSYSKKQLEKYRALHAQHQAELDNLRKELEGYRSGQKREKTLDDFETVSDYLKYVAKEAVTEKPEQQKPQTSQEPSKQISPERQAWLEERNERSLELAQKAMQEIPDYQQVLLENSEIVNGMPDHIGELFLETDRPELAAYALLKEGKLESLAYMSPHRAALEIAKAEERGLAMTAKKPVTKSPAPIHGVKGSTESKNNSLERMSADELLAWVRKQ